MNFGCYHPESLPVASTIVPVCKPMDLNSAAIKSALYQYRCKYPAPPHSSDDKVFSIRSTSFALMMVAVSLQTKKGY